MSQEVIVIHYYHSNPKIKAALASGQPTQQDHAKIEAVARSQLRVFQTIQGLFRNNPLPIVVEGFPERKKDPEVSKYYKKIFPNGKIPDKYEDLNDDQCAFLAGFGAAGAVIADEKGFTKWFSDDLNYQSFNSNIPIENKSIPKNEEALTSTDKDKLKKYGEINQIREYLILQKAEQAAEQTGSYRVIVLIGGTHNIEATQKKCFPNMKIRTIDATTSITDLTMEEAIKKYDKYRDPNIDCKRLANGFKNRNDLTGKGTSTGKSKPKTDESPTGEAANKSKTTPQPAVQPSPPPMQQQQPLPSLVPPPSSVQMIANNTNTSIFSYQAYGNAGLIVGGVVGVGLGVYGLFKCCTKGRDGKDKVKQLNTDRDSKHHEEGHEKEHKKPYKKHYKKQ